MLIATIGTVVFKVLVVAVMIAALRLGGRDEKEAAFIMVIAALVGEAAGLLADTDRGFAWGVLVVDMAVLAGFMRVVLRSDRFWPLWAAAFQLVALLSHAPAIIEPDLARQAYGALQQAWGFPILAAITLGTREAARAVAQ